MATATVEQQTTTETLESYRQRIDSLAHDLQLEGIKLEEDENALVKLRGQYDDECRALALGKNADPVKVQQKMQPVEARIEGRKGLIAEKHKALVALEGPYATLWQADAKRKQEEELEKLQTDRMKATAKRERAAEAWAIADRECAAAIRQENDYIDRRSREEQRLARERR
jgi:hypothetical protein